MLELYSRQFPDAPPLDLTLLEINDFTYKDVHCKGSLVQPGIGWVRFDRADDALEDYELVYAYTRMFKVLGKDSAGQYLTPVVIKTGNLSETGDIEFGVTQVHSKNWFDDGFKQAFSIV